MAEHSRRAFIRGAGVTAAAATVAVMVPGVASAASKSSDPTTAQPAPTVGRRVRQGRQGRHHHGDARRARSEVTDKALARKLAKLAASSDLRT